MDREDLRTTTISPEANDDGIEWKDRQFQKGKEKKKRELFFCLVLCRYFRTFEILEALNNESCLSVLYISGLKSE